MSGMFCHLNYELRDQKKITVMRNIGLGQILVVLLLCFLLFGDLSSLKKLSIETGKWVRTYLSKNRKGKGN